MRLAFRSWSLATRWIASSASGSIPERITLAPGDLRPVFAVAHVTDTDVRAVVASVIPGMLVSLP
jgi:hypothetical protein